MDEQRTHPTISPVHRTPFRDGRSAHLLRAMVVGVVAGLIAVGFRWTLAETERARGSLLDYLHGLPHADAWGWAVLPVIAMAIGCAVGWFVCRYAPDAPGSGIPHIKGVLLHIRHMNWRKLVPVKFIGGALGTGAGLSLGREGPTVQMGAAVGQATADILRVPARLTPQLLSCGAGAGLAAAFNAPLAGFLFVIEELHRELSARTFAGALVAAIAADIVARALAGELPSFGVSGFATLPLSGLPIAALIGALGGVMAVGFNRSLLGMAEAVMNQRRVPRWMHPGIAAAVCAAAAWWLPEAVGAGHATAEHLLTGHLGFGLAALAVLLLVKYVLTLVSYASGAPGGVFAPMLLFGAILGTMVSVAAGTGYPPITKYTTSLAVLGMAAFFTGSVRAPLTGIVLVIEMTGNYEQLLSLGVTCLMADLAAGAVRGKPIYEAMLEQDLRRRPPAAGALTDGNDSEARSVYVGVQRGSALEAKPIHEAGFPEGCLVVMIERAGRDLLPEADFVLLPGDHLTVLVPAEEPAKAIEVVHLATGL